MHLAGVFNGDLDHGADLEPVQADIPSFWDGFVIGSYTWDFASAIDVGISAVYFIGALQSDQKSFFCQTPAAGRVQFTIVGALVVVC